MTFKRVKLFALIFTTLLILSFLTGFPKPFYTYALLEGESGTGERYDLELRSILINLVFALLSALALTIFWAVSKRSLPPK
jgi:hypothetical protein